jgi:hypothetical protein
MLRFRALRVMRAAQRECFPVRAFLPQPAKPDVRRFDVPPGATADARLRPYLGEVRFVQCAAAPGRSDPDLAYRAASGRHARLRPWPPVRAYSPFPIRA